MNGQVKTVAIAVIVSVILSTLMFLGLIYAVPQLRENLQGEQGAQGVQGVQGLQGPKGDTGNSGLVGPSGFREPDYDSGWVPLEGRIVVNVTHNLNTSDIFVYALAKWYRNWTDSGGPMVHQFYYGGDRYWTGSTTVTEGFYWDTYTNYPNSVEVSCYMRVDEIRVLIWKLE